MAFWDLNCRLNIGSVCPHPKNNRSDSITAEVSTAIQISNSIIDLLMVRMVMKKIMWIDYKQNQNQILSTNST